MTVLPEGYAEDARQDYESVVWEAQPLEGVESRQHTRRVPEYSSCMTWSIPAVGAGLPVQILQRQPQRFKAKIVVTGVGSQSTQVFPANPPAGSNFTYTNTTTQAQTLLSLRATLVTDATVLNRFTAVNVRDASGNVLWSVNNGVAVVASSTLTFNGYVGATQQNSGAGVFTLPLAPNLTIPPGGSVVIGAPTLGAGDQISAVNLEIGVTVAIVFNSKLDPVQGASPQGFTVSAAGSLPDWESQQPLYAIATGGGATLSVWDETYAVR